MVVYWNITDMVGACFLLLGFLSVSRAFHCPHDDGKYAHEVECNAFYKCTGGRHHLFTCPPGYYYNTAIDNCDRPQNVLDCVEGHRIDFYRQKLGEKPETPKASTYQNWFHCPDDGNFAHPTDCRYFYWCNSGRAEKQACPPGTLFSRRDNLCTWPHQVPECSGDGTRNGGDVYVAAVAARRSDLVPGKCDNDTEYLPHPRSCTVYLWCAGTRQLIQRCPPNTLYSALDNVCTWPHLAEGCDIYTGKRIGGATYSVKEISHRTKRNARKVNVDKYQGWYDHFECPEESGYFPHEEDCNVFYWCINWQHQLSNCAPGSFFNDVVKACTWPREVPECDEHDGHRLMPYRNKGLSRRHKRSERKIPKAVTFQSVDAKSVCPEDYGYFPHPADCRKYYWCLGPIAYEQTCSGELLFDPVILRCSWKHTIQGCDANGRRTSPYMFKEIANRRKRSQPINQGGYGPDEFKCPEMDGTYRHQYNCSIFYVCKNGHPTQFTCNLGSVLNPSRNNCDWPKNVVDCDPRGVRIGSLPAPPTEEEKKIEKRRPRSTHKHTDADHHRQPIYTNFRCPSQDGFYGHEIDCRVYYWCINGLPTKMLCAGGTFFNPTLGNCGPINMRPDCDVYTGLRFDFRGERHGRKKRQTQGHTHTDHQTQPDYSGSVSGGTGGGWGSSVDTQRSGSSFQCPERDGHYADPDDCSAYYWCVQGKPNRQQCTGGTVYNPLLYSCDHAWKVPGCNGGVSSYRAHEKRIKHEATHEHTQEDHHQRVPSSGFRCPGPDGRYPHPTDCVSYFWCVNGKANLQKCSGGAVFNPALHSCDHPWKVAGCEPLTDLSQAKPPSEPLIVRKKRNEHDSFSNDEYFECPVMDGTYRHKTDCSVYYKCSNGYPTRYSCSGGSVYNPETYNCGWANQVDDCDDNGQRIRNAAMHGFQVSGGGRRLRSTHGIDESGFRCPSSYGYFRHPTDCKKYYWCVKNQPRLMSCQGDNYFDLAIRRCHWPWKQLDCDSNGMRVFRHKRSPIESEIPKGNTGQDTKSVVNAEKPEEKTGPTLFQCPDRDGYYRHSLDCTRYFWCVAHQVTEVQCAEGTVYNPDIRGCDMPFNVPDCDADGLRRTPYQSDWHLQFRCPKGNNSDGYYRHPSDCAIYYRCNYGKRTSYRCTPGTYFDPLNNVCTWPGEVIDCDRNGKIIVNTYKEEPVKKTNDDKNVRNSTVSTPSSTVSLSTVKTTVNTKDVTKTSNHTTTAGLQHTPKSTWWSTVLKNTRSTKLPVASTTKLAGTTKSATPLAEKPEVTKVTNRLDVTGVTTKQPAVTVVTAKLSKTTQTNERKYRKISVSPVTTGNGTSHTPKYRPITTQPNVKPSPLATTDPTTTTHRKATASVTTTTTQRKANASVTTTTTQRKATASVTTTTTAANERRILQNDPGKPKQKQDKSAGTKAGPYLGISAYNFGFKCPYQEGYFRDMTDCAAYFHCRNGTPYRRDCQADHYYSPASSTCIPAYLVTDCHQQVEPTPFYYPEHKENNEFVCPELFGYFPDPDDCASYFECIDGRYYNHRCMLGTYFDPKKRKCTWENLVTNCPSNKLITTDDLTNGFFCPAPSGVFRDPSTCTLYFECDNGVPNSKACAAGTFFDANKRKCTWADMVDECDEFGRPRPIKQSVFKNQQAVNPNNFNCPLPNGHFRDVRDCSLFYHCVKNVAYSGRCKDHNAFDVYSLRCVPRAMVEGCDIMPTVPLMALTTPTPLDFKCPKSYGYFRDYYNCSVYYYCVSGVYFRHTCKAGSVFHKEKNTCTWPHLVTDCHANGTIIKQGDEAGVIDRKQSDYDTLQLGESQSQSGPTAEELEAFSEFRCPALFDGFYGDYLSCSKFYRCVGGKRYDFVCPNGTFFDKARRVCNFMEDVIDCSRDGFRINAAGENQNEIAVEVKPLLFPKTEIDIPEPRCPESDGLFPDPSSCDRFIYCSRFVPMMLPCPDKLLFNVEKKTCDYSDNVICVRYD